MITPSDGNRGHRPICCSAPGSGGTGCFSSATRSAFHKKIGNGPPVFPGIAGKASSNEVLKAVVAPFRDGHNMIESSGEAAS